LPIAEVVQVWIAIFSRSPLKNGQWAMGNLPLLFCQEPE